MPSNLLRLCGAALFLFLTGCATQAPISYPAPNIIRDVPQIPTAPFIQNGPPIVTEEMPRLYPPVRLYLCGGRVTNPPPVDRRKRVAGYGRMVQVTPNLSLVLAPVTKGCFSSGFGYRNGRPHNGIDLASASRSEVFAGGAGVIVEIKRSNVGYGNQILIYHGENVYTRYGHLASFADGLQEGQYAYYGMPIGIMGTSGNSTGVHLHYEILYGVYKLGDSKSLTTYDPMSFPLFGATGDG